jgi:hypothetical protein
MISLKSRASAERFEQIWLASALQVGCDGNGSGLMKVELVTQAQAGIQRFCLLPNWIPVFAGMTVTSNFT